MTIRATFFSKIQHIKIKTRRKKKMTKGNFVLIENGKIYMSMQFNGDMYPSCNGKYVYYLLKHINSKSELRKAIKKFDEARFGFEEYYGMNTTMLEEPENLDFSDKYFSRYNSDYLYIKNIDNTPFTITDVDGVTHKIMPDEIQIWHYGKFTEKDKDELHMTTEEKAEVDEKYAENTTVVYDEDDDVSVLIKLVIKTLMPYAVHNGIKNDVFSLNLIENGKDIPNFVYGDISVFWHDNVEDDFKVITNRKLDLHDIAKMNSECQKILKNN